MDPVHEYLLTWSKHLSDALDQYALGRRNLNEKTYQDISDLRKRLHDSPHDFETELRIVDSVTERITELVSEMELAICKRYLDLAAVNASLADPKTPWRVSRSACALVTSELSGLKVFQRRSDRLLYELEKVERAEQGVVFCQNQRKIMGGEVEDGDDCAICFARYLDGAAPGVLAQEAIRLPCHHTHTFHMDCISAWLKQDDRCPYCRTVLFQAIEPLECL